SVRTPSPRPRLRPAILVLALLLLVAGAWALGRQMAGPQTPTTDQTPALAEPTPTRPVIPDNEKTEAVNAVALQEAPEIPTQVIPGMPATAEAEAAAVRPPVS